MSTHRIPTPSWLVAPLVLFLLLATSCCTSDGDANAAAPGGGTPADPHAVAPGTPAGTAAVLERMDAGGYTYVALQVDGEPTWFAGPPTAVQKGDAVVIPSRDLPMRNFRSDTLDRTFDVVYFVDAIRKVGDADAARTVRDAHAAARQQAGDATPAAIDLTGIPKAEGGLTVAEVFARGKQAAGEDVVLRGKVVKYNANILGKNWLHVRDGSGADGTNDITVTTTDTAAEGDTVLVRGKIAADRDFGFGYTYELLIEDAALTIE